VRAALVAKDGLARLGKPEDVAALALFLCSERPAHQERRSRSMAARRRSCIDTTNMAAMKPAACVMGGP
jgi:NAD(P)-dependent dehydrogenase (short-subunit alcohol dehydrogenase family)